MAYFYNRSIFSQYGFLAPNGAGMLCGELLMSTVFERCYLALTFRPNGEEIKQAVNIRASDLPLLRDVLEHNRQRITVRKAMRASISEHLEFVRCCNFQSVWATQIVELRRVQDLPFHCPTQARLTLTLTEEQYDSLLLHLPRMIELSEIPILESPESYSLSMYRCDALQHREDHPTYYLTPEEVERQPGVILSDDHLTVSIDDDDYSYVGREEELDLPDIDITDEDIRNANAGSFNDLLNMTSDDLPFLTPPTSDASLPRTSSPINSSPCLLDDIVPALQDLPTHSLSEIAVRRPDSMDVVHGLLVRLFMDKIKYFAQLDGPLPFDMSNAMEAQDCLCSEWRLVMDNLAETLFQLGYNLNTPTDEQMIALLHGEGKGSPFSCAIFCLQGHPCHMKVTQLQNHLLDAIYRKFSEAFQ